MQKPGTTMCNAGRFCSPVTFLIVVVAPRSFGKTAGEKKEEDGGFKRKGGLYTLDRNNVAPRGRRGKSKFTGDLHVSGQGGLARRRVGR